jgi:multiple sugar transport system permease protein
VTALPRDRAPRPDGQRPRGRWAGPPGERRRLGWLLLSPALLVVLAVTVVPVCWSVWLSLQRYDLRFGEQRGFVGLRNYGSVLTSPVFWSDLAATGVITGIAVTLEMLLGLGIAVVLHRATAGQRLVRTAVLLPYGIVTVVSAFAWRYLFTPDLSFLTDRVWLAGRTGSFTVVILTEVWKNTPFVALLLLAALAAVPEELLETARVDGASRWQRITQVVLPGIRPVLLVVVLFRLLDTLRAFDTVFVQTGGAYGTRTLSVLAYDQLVDRVNLGLGSAVSVLLFALSAGVALAFLLVFRADLRQLRGPER